MDVPHDSLMTVAITVHASQVWICGCCVVQFFPFSSHCFDIIMSHASGIFSVVVHVIEFRVTKHEQHNLDILEFLHGESVAVSAVWCLFQQVLVQGGGHALKVLPFVRGPWYFGARPLEIVNGSLLVSSWLSRANGRFQC